MESAPVLEPIESASPEGAFPLSDPGRWILAILSLGGAAIHLVMVPAHAGEWLPEGVALALAGWLPPLSCGGCCDCSPSRSSSRSSSKSSRLFWNCWIGICACAAARAATGVATRIVGAPRGEPPFYRMAELHFDSMEELQRAAASEGGIATARHAIKMSTGGPVVFMIGE